MIAWLANGSAVATVLIALFVRGDWGWKEAIALVGFLVALAGTNLLVQNFRSLTNWKWDRVRLIGGCLLLAVGMVSMSSIVALARGEFWGNGSDITMTVPPKTVWPNKIEASGKAMRLGQGETIWVLVAEAGQEETSEFGYLQPGPCDIDAEQTWRCPDIVIGDASRTGRTFEVIVVSADSRATRQIVQRLFDSANAHQPELRNMSPGTRGLYEHWREKVLLAK